MARDCPSCASSDTERQATRHHAAGTGIDVSYACYDCGAAFTVEYDSPELISVAAPDA
jgi:transposase-like protein